MWLAVVVDRPTAVEALEAARQARRTGRALAVGPALLWRGGAPIVAALQEFGPVFVDGRVSGGRAGLVAGVRHLAAAGARWVTVDGRVAGDGIEEAQRVVRPFGTRIVVVGVPPEGEGDPPPGTASEPSRGKQLSRIVAGLSDLDVDVLVGLGDVGVVAQAASGLGVVVADLESAEIEEAKRRGAVGAILATGPGPGPARVAEGPDIAGRIDSAG